tara:strand:- start:910 stop:1515 length:606 start_codon:yes stop_codon:yes gene_type:complete
MYWGTPDISVQFCEDKYVVSEYIAEYYNTLTAAAYIIIGCLFFNTRFKNISVLVMLMGLGTAILHGTLRYYGQWLDEVAMLLLSFFLIKYLREREKKETKSYFCGLIVTLYFIFNKRFHLFVLLFFAMQCYIYKLANKRKAKLNRTKKYIVNIYTTLLLLSMFWWMLDQYFCNYIKSYQLHAFWHVGTALSLGLGLLSLII